MSELKLSTRIWYLLGIRILGLCPGSFKERASLMNQDGHYGVMLTDFNHQGQVCDLVCLLDNSNYPTHRHKDTPLSSYSGGSAWLAVNNTHKDGFKPGEVIMIAAKR